MNAGGRQKAGAVLLTLIGITAVFLLLSFSLKINGTYRFGFLVFICYVVLFSAVSLCLLWGFKDTDVIFIEGEAGEDEHSPDRIMLDGRERRYVDVSERWNLLSASQELHENKDRIVHASVTSAVSIFICPTNSNL